MAEGDRVVGNPMAWEPPDLEMEEWSDTFVPQREWGVGRGGWVSNSTYLLIALFLGGVGSGAALIALALERANSDWYFIAGYIIGVGGKGFLPCPVPRESPSWLAGGIAVAVFLDQPRDNNP